MKINIAVEGACCAKMREAVLSALVEYDKHQKKFVIHDKGSNWWTIDVCPFCGKLLVVES